jgi:hypothetical protein
MRKYDVDDGDAVEQPAVGNQAPDPGSGVKQEGMIAPTHKYSSRLASIGREPAVATEHPDTR